jgi:hypothetical protein
MLETDLYYPIKDYFEKRGYEVYAEVIEADIVAVKDTQIVVIEMKLNMNLKLLDQCWRWKNRANLVYAAIPCCCKYPWYVHHCLDRDEIGLIKIDFNYYGEAFIRNVESKIERQGNFYPQWEKHLNLSHQMNNVGGSKSSKIYTPYKQTMDAIRKYLAKVKRATAREICENVKHHYSGKTPWYSLDSALRSFEKDWIDWEIDGKNIYFKIKVRSVKTGGKKNRGY